MRATASLADARTEREALVPSSRERRAKAGRELDDASRRRCRLSDWYSKGVAVVVENCQSSAHTQREEKGNETSASTSSCASSSQERYETNSRSSPLDFRRQRIAENAQKRVPNFPPLFS